MIKRGNIRVSCHV